MSVVPLYIVLCPILFGLACLVLGPKLDRKCGWFPSLGVLGSLLLLALGFGEELQWETLWWSVGGLDLYLGLHLDQLGSYSAWLVAGVALPVCLYANFSMKEEKSGLPAFYGTLSIFVGAMLALVLSSTTVLLFLAWEAVGVCSFLLISYRHHEEEARRAGVQAFLMTRTGDMGLLLAMGAILFSVGTTRIDTFLAELGSLSGSLLLGLALLLVWAAAAKSAQLPFTAWLPRAMVGPTPVSALLHSATMVAAGVLLLLKFYPLFAIVPAARQVLLWMGAITALTAALVATATDDLKEVLAWSTASQLGEMMMALGLAGPLAASFHLVCHALFKSTLFLAAGDVDHQAGTRKLSHVKGALKTMPFTGALFLVAALSLAGIPPLSGFWSEDRILTLAHHDAVALGLFVVLLVFLAGTYIGRAAGAVFRGTSEKEQAEAGYGMLVPTAILALGAALAGWTLHGSMEALVPFDQATGSSSLAWKALGAAAGVAGLALGAMRGATPVFGSWTLFFSRGQQRAVAATSSAFMIVAGYARRCESGLDWLARTAGQAVLSLGRCARFAESSLDWLARSAGRAVLNLGNSENQVERMLDTVSSGAAQGAMRAALSTRRFEDVRLGPTVDRGAALFSGAGRRLQPLQSGKIFLYAMGLFVWVAVAGLAAWSIAWT